MIFYGVGTTYFLCGVAAALLVLSGVLAVVAWFLERKAKKMRDEWEELERKRRDK